MYEWKLRRSPWASFRLSSLRRREEATESRSETESPSTDADRPAGQPSSSAERPAAKKRTKVVQVSWLSDPEFKSWLACDETNGVMTCRFCLASNFDNIFTRGCRDLQRSALVRIRPWPLRWVLGQGSLLPLSQGEAFTIASISYLGHPCKIYTGQKKKKKKKTHQPDHLQRSLQSSRWRRTTESERDCRAERADVSRGSCLLAGKGGGHYSKIGRRRTRGRRTSSLKWQEHSSLT